MTRMLETDTDYMLRALQLARRAEREGEVPVGAVVISEGQVIGEGWNQNIGSNDPSAHAEIIALRDAGRRLSNHRLVNATLFVTLEPCIMCLGASIHARIERLVYGASDPKTGALGGQVDVQSLARHNHLIEVTAGVLGEESRQLLRAFFKARRGARPTGPSINQS